MVAAIAVNVIVVRLVPTALAGVKEYAKVSSGTMNMPPPTPVMAATVPIKNPRIGRIISHIFSLAISVGHVLLKG